VSTIDPTSDELARTQRELVATRTRLEHTIAAYKAFAYSVSHDLRAPLRAIAGFTGMLEESLHTEAGTDARHFLEIIHENARLLSSQIDGLLALSRIEHAELRPAPVDMTAFARAAIDATRDREPSRHVRAEIGSLPVIVADPELMRRVLAELVANAWKFTRDRTEPWIEIGSEAADAATAFFVRDNGVGFSPESAERLFVVFRRLHGPKEYEGLGLGLATVRAIVSRHGGRTWAECAPESHVTTMWFTLPAETNGRKILHP
jgi:light-regulated signal transduction histidine kinase (bacteriophytochrome)